MTKPTIAILMLSLFALPVGAATPPGEEIYQRACAACHEGGVKKAPHKMFLQMMPADSIHNSMNEGIMQMQAAALSPAERRTVAEYLAGQTIEEALAKTKPQMCTGAAKEFDLGKGAKKVGWGVNRENHRLIPADVAGLTAADLPKLELQWAFAFPNAQRVRSQPTVALGAVFIGSQNGTVYALDKKTGCVRWSFRASAEVRTPVIIDAGDGKTASRAIAYFADLIARVYAVEATTWTMESTVPSNFPQGLRSLDEWCDVLSIPVRRQTLG